MAERKIARTVAEAEAGDLLWHLEPQRNRYDENGKYLGRGVWSITAVKEVRRRYLSTGYRDYSRETGILRDRSGLSGLPQVFGSEERQSNWWEGRQYAIAKAVQDCRDRETLKTIAFALGLDGPPDFTTPALDREEADRHG